MSSGIIADPDVLEEDYIPQNIPCREVQKEDLAFCLSPLKRKIKPLDCICHGKPGTGKTALVKYVLQQLSNNTSALSFYVNCWESKTLNQVLDRILEKVGVHFVEENYSTKVARLREKIKRRACVIALDEIDKLNGKDLNNVLYMLKNLGNVGLLCISNTRKYFLSLDPGITSRMQFKSINFPPYSNQELLTILRQRVEDCRALYPNSYSKEILEKIADLAAGDARIAIQTLRNAAYNAERANRSSISDKDVDKAFEEAKEIKRKYQLEKMGAHYSLIFEIVKKNPRILSSSFYSVYKKEAKERGLAPKSIRTFSNYVNELIELSYLKVDRAKTRGNVRTFNVS